MSIFLKNFYSKFYFFIQVIFFEKMFTILDKNPLNTPIIMSREMLECGFN